MAHADLDETLEDGDGVLRHELLECDQEAGLHCDAAADGGEPGSRDGQRRPSVARQDRAVHDRMTLPVTANQAM